MDLAEKYGIDMSYEHKTACPRCRKNGRDNSGNNLHVYGPGKGAFCWGDCGFTIPSDDHKAAMGWDEEEQEEEVVTREKITEEQNAQLKAYYEILGPIGLVHPTTDGIGVSVPASIRTPASRNPFTSFSSNR